MGVLASINRAWPLWMPEAEAALDLLHTWGDFPRVPGICTVLRLAVRVDCGRTPEEAAAREYLYRWELALRSPIFGVPPPPGLVMPHVTEVLGGHAMFDDDLIRAARTTTSVPGA
jgi:hypothetical protein